MKRAERISKEAFDRDSEIAKKKAEESENKTKEYKLKIAEKEKVM